MLTKEELLEAPEADYMNEAQIAFFKATLEQLRQDTMDSIEAAKQTLANPPEHNDDADRAAYEEESRLALRIVDRERKLLPKIEAAMRRIATGDFGYCLESGEPIGIPRLLLRPTAELCAEVKAINERRESAYRDA
ncbi:TraR/DksA C4-type zinc finger protein [Marinobacter xestospongiae]|uniref:TraR/DksA C4-type zinc finger protein n=1 Tax=Marinobacter xestospongiae TaxID=994319 RepID=A0ABU3VYL8_9GAMM|nr:TraR/DksA C4-type zinc finger protein [Marinobacter xestospongiae]MCG8518909.1 TraR/DksA C4-type zinc finger protein [Pseudomonadales bacterium]MCK7566067.1 TraR/DksA C4-type zinc finger protein [Marinobacter xestospongiae]MDV2079220.1 TraR/DksA C4-type zinc finger protein [Marinobacter xestospongiae]